MARTRRIMATATAGLVLAATLNSSLVGAEGNQRGRLLDTYRDNGGARPAWVVDAAERSLKHFESQGKSRDSFVLRGVDRDDIATHVRFDQTFRGIPVFGGQVIAHLDQQGNVFYDNGTFVALSKIDTKPAVKQQQAIDNAIKALGYTGAFVNKPEANLVILPREADTVLAYLVSLQVEDGTDATGHYEYFINAKDGSVAFTYNSLDTENKSGAPRMLTAVAGTGNSLYSGTVSLGTDLVSGVYYLRDLNRGGMETVDLKNKTNGSGSIFTGSDSVWGTGSNSSRESAAVDAAYGSSLTWDYYLNTFGRRGIDGNGYKVVSRVHYGRSYNNAFWNGSTMTYGDGDGATFTPLTSVDVAGHEITHGLTEKTANLVYSGESGASNESFSDIFGTLVEFQTAKGDYDIGEDIYTPGTNGDALRSMSNPGLYGDPDHYSKRYTGTSDNGGVHTNSGIQNQAFYLLAEGGTNRTSGLRVTGITRAKAGAIFYRALTVYLTSSAKFHDVRVATLRAAGDLYGTTSAEYASTAATWDAVGVQ